MIKVQLRDTRLAGNKVTYEAATGIITFIGRSPPDGHIHHPASEDPAADPRLHSGASHTKCAAPYAFVSGATSSLRPRETADIPALLWQKPARATKQGA